jgi:outer membrane lipoprotein-sorting protein
MMENPRDFHHEDLLKRAVEAVRRDPIPDDLPPEQIAKLKAAVQRAAERPYPSSIIERIQHMKPRTKLAVAATVLAAVFGLTSWLLPGGGTALAFADVADALNKIQSATWKTSSVTTVKPPGAAEETTVTTEAKCMFLAPSRERTETTVAGQTVSIYIVDGQKDKAISLLPATKTALVFNTKHVPAQDSPFGRTFQGLQKLVADAQSGQAGTVERLGAKIIDGRPAEGFRIERGTMKIELWADRESQLPMRVESTIAELKTRTVMTDFQVNMPVEASLFAVDVPSDYTVQSTTEVDASQGWSLVAQALKMAAELNDGEFPAALSGEQGVVSVIQRGAQNLAQKGQGSPKDTLKLSMDVAKNVAAFVAFVAASPPGELHYAGKDVKLGEPNRPIFWIDQKDGERSMVFYADLSFKEVPTAQTQNFPASEGAAKPLTTPDHTP